MHRMQRKVVPYNEFKILLAPNYKRSYATYSPFSPVTLPSRTKFTTWSGTQSYASGSSVLLGGFEICRTDPKDPVLFNFDRYLIYSTVTPGLVELDGSGKPDYHWADDLPTGMKQDAPNWVQDLVGQETRRLAP